MCDMKGSLILSFLPFEGVFRWCAFVSITRNGCICQASWSFARRVDLVFHSGEWPWWFSSWVLKCGKYYRRVTHLMIKSMQENKIFCYYVLKFIPRNYVFIGGYHYCWQNHTRAFNKKNLFKILTFPLSIFYLTHILTWSNICFVGIIRDYNSYWNRNIVYY